MAKKDTLQIIEGSVLAPQGFKACGIFCDIKRLGTGKGSNKGQKRDLGLLVSDVPAVAAGMFTTSLVCAAPVKVRSRASRYSWPRPWASCRRCPWVFPTIAAVRVERPMHTARM